MKGRNFCRSHGGKVRRGAAHPNWKGGFFSSMLPTDLAAMARRAMKDPELENMRSLIAILDIRIQEIVAQISGGIGEWDRAADALGALQDARGDVDRTREVLADLDRIIISGRARETAWKAFESAIEKKDKLLTGEVQRHKATADMVAAERAATMLVAMFDALAAEAGENLDLVRRVEAKWEKLAGLAGMTAPAPKRGERTGR